LTINYTSIYSPQASTGLPARNQTILLSLKLRTLGEIKTGIGLGTLMVNDGVRSEP
jgi:LPS-assembly protein